MHQNLKQEMKGLSQAVAEAGFLQYAAHLNKMELAEFLYFAKVKINIVHLSNYIYI